MPRGKEASASVRTRALLVAAGAPSSTRDAFFVSEERAPRTQKHTPNGSFTIGGAAFTTANVVQLFQGLADAIAKVDVAKAGWEDARTSMDAEHAKVVPVLRGYQSLLLATYSNAPATLAD
jgi:hypothetical protein